MKEYVMQLQRTSDGSAKFSEPFSHSPGIYRINVGDSLIFKFYASCGDTVYLYDISERVVAHLKGSQQSPNDPFLVTPQWTASTPGPVNLRFENISKPLDSFFEANNTIVVSPNHTVSDLRMLTVMPRRLGPMANWEGSLETLAVTKGYNAVHFTPCQPSGASHSSYSIRDVLDVDPMLFPMEALDCEQRWDRLKETLSKFPNLKKITDIVLNHASSCDSWATRTPEATYCLAQCPYLTGAADLDERLSEFSEAHPEYLGMDSEEQLRECMHHIRVLLEKFEFSEYFQLDLLGSAELWGDPEVKASGVPGLWQALEQCGTARGLKIIINLKKECADIVSVWRELHAIQQALANSAKQCFTSALEAIESTLRYERLVARKLDGPLIPMYFTKLPNGDSAANNGWVINWPAGIDFASPGHHLVFMRRHVMAWGDCLKLRYANERIWNVMESYCDRIARIFDGVRLDNCHSTPIAVLRRLINVMRTVNPNLIVMAELFTGDAMNDEIYEATVGIDLLVKEGMQIGSLDELLGKVWRCANKGIADVPFHCLKRTKASAIIYDATHDNKTCFEKFGSFRQALPLAAACAAAPCAIGSSIGFDSLATSMPSVVSRNLDSIENANLFETNFDRIFLPGFPEAKSASVFGSWDHWDEGLELERTPTGWKLPESIARTLELVPSKTQYKFFVNQIGWLTNPTVGLAKSAGGFWNNLFGTSGVFSDAKRELLRLHAIADEAFFADTRDGILEIKRISESAQGYVFLINFGPNPDVGYALHSLESEIDSLALAISLCRSPGSDSEEVQSLTLTHFDGQIIHWSESDLDLNRETKTVLVPEYGVVILRTKPSSVIEKLSSLTPPPLNEVSIPADFSYALFSCEAEETVYDIPEKGKLVFAGFAGAVHEINLMGDDFLASPLASNIRSGDWLFYFTVARLESRFPELFRWFSEEVRPAYTALAPGLKPKWFVVIFRDLVYKSVVDKLEFGEDMADLERNLRLASFQFTVRESVAAGLPHFASGYMRCWGRDTFIAFPGLFLTTGRFSEGRKCLLAFARVVRHGLIPNLFDDGWNPRYNSRDACWCFLNALRKYIEISEDFDILSESVELKYPDRAFSHSYQQPTTASCPLITVVEGILMSHLRGIDFVEENAGPRIDEHMTERGFRVTVRVNHDGLIVGGNEWNCGTWMDKMGSVEGVNRGVPATSRFGANVEINGLAISVLNFFQSRVSQTVKPEINRWYKKLVQCWDRMFWNPENGCYKDTILGDPKGDKFRPNALFALSQIPLEAVNIAHAKSYLEKCEESLLGPIGMRTLSASDPDFNGWYDNSDPSGGYNYHSGPEWVWLTGHYLMAAKRFGVGDLTHLIERLDAFVKENSGPWMSLPELTNAGGPFCQHSCPSQAWSVCCVLEALNDP